jgi:hypothetical protein
MRLHRLLTALVVGFLMVMVAACENKSKPAPDATVGDRGSTESSGKKVPMGQMIDSAKRVQDQVNPLDFPPPHPSTGTTLPAELFASGATLPAGHPPIGGAATTRPSNLPPGHPPTEGSTGMGGMGMGEMAAEPQKPEHMLQLNPPATWTSRPARMMTVAVYGLPKTATDPADAELTISHYPDMKNVTVDKQAERWASMFVAPGTQPSTPPVRQYKLDKAPHPATIVDIAGRYAGGRGEPKDNYRMISAVVETDQGPWFFKLVGPSATVSQHEQELLTFVRNAK